MSFTYKGNQFFAEECSVADLAKAYGTPLFVYSKAAIEANWQQFAQHWPAPHKLCYAVKANSNLAVLNLLARLGAGFDIVSGGELARVLAAGGKAQDVVFPASAKVMTKLPTRWIKISVVLTSNPLQNLSVFKPSPVKKVWWHRSQYG